MVRSLAAHFDGKVIVPDEPVTLPVGEPLHIQVTIPSKKGPGKRRAKIIGLGRFSSGVHDLGSNKERLKGFGK